MCEHDRAFQANELLVDRSYFPIEVKLVQISPVSHHGAVERLLFEVYSGDEKRVATNEVERWAWSSQAEVQYRDSVDTEFSYTNFPCCISDQLDLGSFAADELTVHCSTEGYCKVVARYQEYVITFGMETSSELAKTDFRAIFAKINQNIAKHLGLR